MPRSLPAAPRRSRVLILAIILVLLLVFGRSICSFIVDYLWWGEMAQVDTWVRMLAVRYVAGIAEWVLVFVVLWLAHARGMKYAGTGLRDEPRYARIATAVLAFVSLIIAAALTDGWTIARYAAGRGVETAWHDP